MVEFFRSYFPPNPRLYAFGNALRKGCPCVPKGATCGKCYDGPLAPVVAADINISVSRYSGTNKPIGTGLRTLLAVIPNAEALSCEVRTLPYRNSGFHNDGLLPPLFAADIDISVSRYSGANKPIPTGPRTLLAVVHNVEALSCEVCAVDCRKSGCIMIVHARPLILCNCYEFYWTCICTQNTHNNTNTECSPWLGSYPA